MKKQLSVIAVVCLSLALASCDGKDTTFLSRKTPLENGEHIGVEKNFIHENVLCMNNADQTKTLYLYSSPIYCKDEGQDEHVLINNALMQEEDGEGVYVKTLNDIQCRLPEKLASENPVILKQSYTEMAIYLQMDESRKAGKKTFTNMLGYTGEGLLYKKAFGNNECYVMPDDFGVNMEINISDQNTTAVSYLVEMENVTLDTKCPDYVLLRGVKENDVKGIIYKPLVKDRDGTLLSAVDSKTCEMTVDEEEAGIYRVNITFNSEFLENAQYPLTVNGSLHLYKSKQPDSAIYSRSGRGYYLNDKVVLGNSQIRGEAHLLVRFEALDLIDIKAEDIISAEYILSEISGGEEDATIAVYPVTSDWCSINSRWNNKPRYDKENASRATVGKSGDYSFDITQSLKNWILNKGKETEYIIRHGFVLVNETPDVPKIFATGDNGMFTSCLKIKLRKVEE